MFSLLWMTRGMIYRGLWLAAMLVQGCVPPPPGSANRMQPGPEARRIVLERVSAVVVAKRESVQDWAVKRFPRMYAHEDVDGGSATPIAADGYFLTADHVLARVGKGRVAFVVYRWNGNLVTAKARVVWRSAGADLAMLHAPLKTPYFYQWTPPDRWVPEGAGVIHGGIVTGLKPGTGKLVTPLAPEHRLTWSRSFKIDIPLQPGDSGGPVVDASGNLVGINSAVEFLVPVDTAFFVDSEGQRPNTRMIDDLIKRDRLRNMGTNPTVEKAPRSDRD
ncbi:MAG: serine protease [Verrucomicrobiota bacterium]